MLEASLPSSATLTDLSTPPFDSPGTFSQNPSPLFTELDLMGPDDWTPLFQDGSAAIAANHIDNAIDLATSTTSLEPQPEVSEQSILVASPAP